MLPQAVFWAAAKIRLIRAIRRSKKRRSKIRVIRAIRRSKIAV